MLSAKACAVMGRTEKANPRLELCSGKKRSYPTVGVYHRKKSKNSEERGTYHFKLDVICNLNRIIYWIV